MQFVEITGKQFPMSDAMENELSDAWRKGVSPVQLKLKFKADRLLTMPK